MFDILGSLLIHILMELNIRVVSLFSSNAPPENKTSVFPKMANLYVKVKPSPSSKLQMKESFLHKFQKLGESTTRSIEAVQEILLRHFRLVFPLICLPFVYTNMGID